MASLMLDRLRHLLVPAAADDGPVEAAPVLPMRELFRRFAPYARPYRWWFAVVLVFIVLAAAAETATIWLFKVIVDDVLVPRDFGPFLWIAGIYVAITVGAGLVSFADDYLSTWVGERFLLALRTDVFRHLHSLSMDFFERRRLGDLLSRLTGDVAAIESFVLSGVADTMASILRLAFFLGALFYLQWDLTLVALLVVPLFWWVARRFSRLIKTASREKRRRSGSISAVAEESLANAALVQATNGQETEVERFHRESVGAFSAQMASTRIKALFTPLIDLIELLGGLIVIGMGTFELSRGRLSLGELLAFLTFLTQLYGPVRGLSRLSNLFYSASASAERIAEVLSERPAVQDRPDAVVVGRARGALHFEAVAFVYPGTERTALQDVSFAVEPGQTLALVGASGAGKSTLAKLALRFYDPTEGAVFLDGRDLRDLRLRELRENVAVLLQETLVFHGTIGENISYGRPGATAAQIERAARAADAHEFISALPGGYDTVVGQRGRRLSGGQRQRVAIARAMIRDAPVLVLDEPTTGLDAGSAERVLEPLRRLMDGRSTIMISHNLLTAREADQIAVLDAGRVVQSGTHDELMALGGAYERLYRLHAPAAVLHQGQ